MSLLIDTKHKRFLYKNLFALIIYIDLRMFTFLHIFWPNVPRVSPKMVRPCQQTKNNLIQVRFQCKIVVDSFMDGVKYVFVYTLVIY